MKRQQKGLGAVEGLLVLIIVGLVAFVGWYVWHTKNNTDKTYNNAASNSSSSQLVVYKYKTPPSTWKTYSNVKYKVAFSYPADWKLTAVEEKSSLLVSMLPPESSKSQNSTEYSLEVIPDQTLDQRKSLEISYLTNTHGVTYHTSTKNISYNGHSGVIVSVSSQYPNVSDIGYESRVILGANGNAYILNPLSNNPATFKNKDIQSVFESLKVD